jgi:hypothetical protein
MGLFGFFKKKEDGNLKVDFEREKFILEEARKIIEEKNRIGENMGELIIGADGKIKKASEVKETNNIDADLYKKMMEEKEMQEKEMMYKKMMEEKEMQEKEMIYKKMMEEKMNAQQNSNAREEVKQAADPYIITISLVENMNIDIAVSSAEEVKQLLDYLYYSILEKKIIRISNRLIPVDKILCITNT